MTKIFLDTSIFIRLFTGDLRKESEDCEKLLTLILNGTFVPYTSSIVLFEIFFVLTRLYKFNKKDVAKILRSILKIRNITLIEKTNTNHALDIFDKYKIKYADCLIAGQVARGITLVTYDSDFNKIKSLKTMTPIELISN